jgi:hypothetical protein
MQLNFSLFWRTDVSEDHLLPFHSDQRKSARLAFISGKVFPIPACRAMTAIPAITNELCYK